MSVVREGRSFSGHERNCAFLNLGDGTFAESSAITGFDLPDDGRALALVDWDQDGDLDLWVSNRNGPQVRFFSNTSRKTGHFLTLSLEGTRSNRDAIGARVMIYDAENRLVARSLNAGDGFLSQSSKQLLLGLGATDRVAKLQVRWPKGELETFAIPDQAVDRHYRLIEGAGIAEQWAADHRNVQLASQPAPASQPQSTVGAMSFSMIPIPVNAFLSLSGHSTPVTTPEARLTLVTLWASWCQPCLKELAMMTRDEQRLREHQIDVVAVSLDALTSKSAEGASDKEWLDKLAFPFRSARAQASDLEKLQLLHDTVFELHTPLPIPTSFLVDRRGRVVAIYKGPVTTEELIRDSNRLRVKTTDEWRRATLPFDGRWEMPPRRRHLFDFARQLAERGYREEARRYVEQNREMFEAHPQLRDLQQLMRGNAQ